MGWGMLLRAYLDPDNSNTANEQIHMPLTFVGSLGALIQRVIE